jgi:hypothetical protein
MIGRVLHPRRPSSRVITGGNNNKNQPIDLNDPLVVQHVEDIGANPYRQGLAKYETKAPDGGVSIALGGKRICYKVNYIYFFYL